VMDGFFEARIPNQRSVFSYLLEVHYPDNCVYTLRDPYSFLPTLGELDLYFAGEGRHEKLWQRMGAHPTHHHGSSGVSFAVWAPPAAGVPVVGDFISWDGRLPAMRPGGAWGIGEFFTREIGEGARKKFEIRPKSAPPLQKAAPFASRTGVPPATA